MYKEFHKEVFYIKKKFQNSILVNSITLLNVIKIHPFYLENINKKINLTKSFFKKTLLEMYYIFSIMYYFYEKKKINFKIKKLKTVFISHLVNKKQILSNDINFGKVEKICKNSFTLYINHTYSKNDIFEKIKKNFLIINRRVSFIDEVIILYNQFLVKKKILEICKSKKNSYLKAIALDAISPETRTNIRIGYQLIKFIKEYRPKFVITTLEGYSWEKYLIFYCKKMNIKVFGYIPYVFLRNLIFKIRNENKNFLPHKLLVVGKSSYNNLKKTNFLKKNIHVIGSYKNNPYKIVSKNQKKKKKIIVIPEGIFSEEKLLFDLINTEEMMKSGYYFNFRLHPVSFNKKKLNYFRRIKLNKNIIINNSNIDDIIKEAQYVIYRGSNLVFKCIKNFCVPIYYQTKNEKKINLNINSLEKNSSFFLINNSFQLKKLLFGRYRKKMIRLNGYYDKFNISKLKKIIS
jgi:hypothetical protein